MKLLPQIVEMQRWKSLVLLVETTNPKIRGIFVGGVLDSVVIVDGGGDIVLIGVQISLLSMTTKKTKIQKNDGYRDDLVDEFGGILSDLPDGGDPKDTGVPRA